MRRVRVLSVIYLVLLSFFLLTRDPTLGRQSMLLWLIKMAGANVHFMSHLLLTTLILAARWPLPGWVTVSGLMTYAVAIELLQSFVPQRTVSWVDGVQNVAGVAVGLAVWRWFQAVRKKRQARPANSR